MISIKPAPLEKLHLIKGYILYKLPSHLINRGEAQHLQHVTTVAGAAHNLVYATEQIM
jgi:hypothetical protein